MPYTLTSAEKAELRRKYIANVNKLNRYLPAGKKLTVDMKAFNAKINDPAKQRFYIKSKAFNENVNKRAKLSSSVGNKFEHLKKPGHVYAFNRGVFLDMLPHDFDPQVQKFNDVMMKEYYTNPEAYAQRRIQNVLKFDAGDLQKIYKSPDIDNHLLDFCEKNEEVLEDCMNLKKNVGAFKSANTVAPELLNNLETIGNNMELIGPCLNAARLVKGDSYFTLPPLTEEQKDLIFESNLLADDEPFFTNMKETINAELSYNILKEEFIKTLDGFEKNNISIKGPGALSKLSGTVIKKNGQTVQVSPVLHYSGHNAGQGKDFKIGEFDKDTVNKMNKVFTKDYIKETKYKHRTVPESLKWAKGGDTFRRDFVYNYATRTNAEIGKVDTRNIGEIAADIKGNWKERILGTTSKQYKSFITALKKYDDENSRKYHNKRNVYNKANDYLIHKGVKSLDDIKRLPHPADERAMLCWDAMDAFEKSIQPNESRYERGTNNTYSPEPQKQKGNPLFFTQKEVEDFELEQDVQPSKQKNIKLDKEDIEDFQNIVDEINEPSIK